MPEEEVFYPVLLPDTTWNTIIAMLGESNTIPRIAFPAIHALEIAVMNGRRRANDPPAPTELVVEQELAPELKK